MKFFKLNVKPVFCAAVKPSVRKYVDLLNDISAGNYETAVTSDVAKLFFSLIQSTNNENSASLDSLILAAVTSFMSAATDEEEAVLKLVVLLLLLLP